MHNVFPYHDTTPCDCPARYRVWSYLCRRGFCYFLLSVMLFGLLSGCLAQRVSAALPVVLTEPASPALVPGVEQTVTITSTVSAAISAGAAQAVATTTTPPTALPQIITITYPVQEDDTLTIIANQYGTTVEAIMQANNLTSDKIYAGNSLIIPSTRAPVPIPSDAAPPTTPLTASGQSTDIQTSADQPATGAGSDTGGQPFRALISWITAHRRLALSLILSATLLVALLAFFAFRHPSPLRVLATQAPSTIAAPQTSSRLAVPPAVGTAYLETRLDKTGTLLYYPLTQPITSIGRDPSNHIAIDHRFAKPDAVSRYHIQIVRAGDGFIAKDMGSANGLLINQRRSRENVLRDGAILGIGQTQFVFRLNQTEGTP